MGTCLGGECARNPGYSCYPFYDGAAAPPGKRPPTGSVCSDELRFWVVLFCCFFKCYVGGICLKFCGFNDVYFVSVYGEVRLIFIRLRRRKNLVG